MDKTANTCLLKFFFNFVNAANVYCIPVQMLHGGRPGSCCTQLRSWQPRHWPWQRVPQGQRATRVRGVVTRRSVCTAPKNERRR